MTATAFSPTKSVPCSNDSLLLTCDTQVLCVIQAFSRNFSVVLRKSTAVFSGWSCARKETFELHEFRSSILAGCVRFQKVFWLYRLPGLPRLFTLQYALHLLRIWSEKTLSTAGRLTGNLVSCIAFQVGTFDRNLYHNVSHRREQLKSWLSKVRTVCDRILLERTLALFATCRRRSMPGQCSLTVWRDTVSLWRRTTWANSIAEASVVPATSSCCGRNVNWGGEHV